MTDSPSLWELRRKSLARARKRWRSGDAEGLHDFRVALRRVAATAAALGRRKLERRAEEIVRGLSSHRQGEVDRALLARIRELGLLSEDAATALEIRWKPSADGNAENGAGELLGAAPCYAKTHSRGEYVFDHSWAEAFERAGGDYYPKLQVAVPFTPVTGPRLLARAGSQGDAVRCALADALVEITTASGLSSAHVTFLTKEEWETLGERSFLCRTDQQFHWENADYTSFDDFLAALASRKRKTIRRFGCLLQLPIVKEADDPAFVLMGHCVAVGDVIDDQETATIVRHAARHLLRNDSLAQTNLIGD